jgi:hypothetical protein
VIDFEQERKNVGPGWQPLIEALHRDLSAVAPGYEIMQIKEKFGGLRYYIVLINNVTDAQRRAAYELVDTAERASQTICEECGTTEGVTNSAAYGWYRTLCVDDRVKLDDLRKQRFNV